jgi:hypothetical protein
MTCKNGCKNGILAAIANLIPYVSSQSAFRKAFYELYPQDHS